jgi:maltose O-acetyltransferase
MAATRPSGDRWVAWPQTRAVNPEALAPGVLGRTQGRVPSSETPPAPASWVRRASALATRIVRAARSELDLDARKLAARAISRGLPQFSFIRTRTALLRAAGIRIGCRSLVMGPLDVTGQGDPTKLFSVGSDTFITGPLHVDLGAPVRIGDHVRIGFHVTLLTGDHEIGPASQRCGRLAVAPIVVGDGVWLASGVTLLPGVVVGDGAIVAAGAVVTHDVAPGTLVGGVPARFVRDLDKEAPRSARRLRSEHPGPEGKSVA